MAHHHAKDGQLAEVGRLQLFLQTTFAKNEHTTS